MALVEFCTGPFEITEIVPIGPVVSDDWTPDIIGSTNLKAIEFTKKCLEMRKKEIRKLQEKVKIMPMARYEVDDKIAARNVLNSSIDLFTWLSGFSAIGSGLVGLMLKPAFRDNVLQAVGMFFLLFGLCEATLAAKIILPEFIDYLKTQPSPLIKHYFTNEELVDKATLEKAYEYTKSKLKEKQAHYDSVSSELSFMPQEFIPRQVTEEEIENVTKILQEEWMQYLKEATKVDSIPSLTDISLQKIMK